MKLFWNDRVLKTGRNFNAGNKDSQCHLNEIIEYEK